MQIVQPSAISQPPTASFRDELLKTIPKLWAYAVSLRRMIGHTDDLMQETLVKALANDHSFEPGSIAIPGSATKSPFRHIL